MDLARWWRDRRWLGLLELIDQLQARTDTRLNEAILNDPVQAALIAARAEDEGEPAGAWSPPVAAYDLHAMMLREVVQTLYAVRAAVLVAGNRKPGKMPEFPTPVTEVDRARARLERVWVDTTLTRWGFDPSDL